jgi:hypothetical protein
VIELKTRAVEIAGSRVDPHGDWTKQVARNLTDRVDGSGNENAATGKVVCRSRLGGMLNFYVREAA